MRWMGPVLAGLLCGAPAHAAIQQGPTVTLEVAQIYDNASYSSIYVSFKQAGSMPGCYAGTGGYLSPSEPNFSRIYSVLLTMMAGRPVRGLVLYETTGMDPATSWGACNIKGLFLLPQ